MDNPTYSESFKSRFSTLFQAPGVLKSMPPRSPYDPTKKSSDTDSTASTLVQGQDKDDDPYKRGFASLLFMGVDDSPAMRQYNKDYIKWDHEHQRASLRRRIAEQERRAEEKKRKEEEKRRKKEEKERLKEEKRRAKENKTVR